jgi:hypothetical protein
VNRADENGALVFRHAVPSKPTHPSRDSRMQMKDIGLLLFQNVSELRNLEESREAFFADG